MTDKTTDERAPRVPHRMETERLILRCYEPADAEALRALCAKNREHLVPWLPWAEQDPQTLDEKLELVLSFRSAYDSGENSVMGIFERASGELVGGTGLHSRNLDPRMTREIGYWISASREGRGYVTEAVKALLVVGFQILDLASLIIRCEPTNLRSRSVPQRLGFVEEGVLRNSLRRTNGELTATHRYGMTRSEFHASEACAEWCKNPLRVAAFDALGRPVAIAGTPR